MNKRIYRQCSAESKREAVRLAEQPEGPITQVARELWGQSKLPELNIVPNLAWAI